MSKYNLTDLISENKMQLTEGTRAMVAYIEGDRITTTYNHYDGYPSNLGKGLETHYNDDAKAKEIANKGYISYLDPDTGDIDAAHKDAPGEVILPDDPEQRAREVAEEIDGMAADYGYIWDTDKNSWVVIKNTGISSMIDQILDKVSMINVYSGEKMEEGEDVKEVTSRVGSRIEGDLDIELKAKFLDAFVDLFQSLEDPYFAEDVVDHLSNEMLKHLDNIQAQGEKLAGVNTDADFEREQRMQMDMREEDSVNEELAPTGIAISQKQLDDLEKLGAIAGLEVTVQDKDGSNVRKVDYTLTNTDFEKDDYDRLDEDLKEHFGRFLKDYQ